MNIRRTFGTCLPCLLFLLVLMPFGSPAATQAATEGISISAAMTAFAYAPGDKASLAVDLEIPAEREDSLTLELLLYPALSSRSQLATFREGKRRSPMVSQDLDVIGPKTEWRNREYALNLDDYGLDGGVYPFEVSVIEGGDEQASSYNFLVVMRASAGKPLNLSCLWSLDFLPPVDAKGSRLDSGLEGACSSSSQQPGFLFSLVNTLKQWSDVPSNVVLPAMTREDLEALAGRAGGAGASDSEKGAADIIKTLNEMSSSGQVDLLGSTYSYADPAGLEKMGLNEDADAQMRSGLQEMKRVQSQDWGFVPPLFDLTDEMVQRLSEGGADFTVVSEEVLQFSSAGRSLLEGNTLAQPVTFAGPNGSLIKAFPRDEQIYKFLQSGSETDPARLTQALVAELAMLQRENPSKVRTCVLAFPPGFMPPASFLETFYSTIKSFTWLRPATLAQLNSEPAQKALPGSLAAPASTLAQTAYDTRLAAVRSEALAYSNAIQLEKHPLKTELARAILVAEDYRFMTEQDSDAGQAYLDAMEDLVKGEVSKVRIEQKRSFMLSSTQGNINVSITSSLDYPITADLKMENPSLIFDNQEGITIRPRENTFSFSVNTHRKGSFLVDIILETGGLVIDHNQTTVNTSVINTMAIILLACLAGIVGAVVLIRRFSNKINSGKHAKGRNNS